MYTFLVAQAAIHRVLEGLNCLEVAVYHLIIRCDDQSAVSHGETYTVKDHYIRF